MSDMKPTDLTVKLLSEIRDEVKKSNQRLAGVEGGLVDLRREVREDLGKLSKRVVDAELRTATALTELAADVRSLTGHLRKTSDLRPRVERCEKDIGELKKRVG